MIFGRLSVAVDLDHLAGSDSGPRRDRPLFEGDAKIVGARGIDPEVEERRVLRAIPRSGLNHAVADERLPAGKSDFGSDRPLLTVRSGELHLQPSAGGRLVDEESVRALLARDEEIEVAVVVRVGENRGAGIDSHSIETDAGERR